MILFAVCDVLSSVFATGLAPLCLSAIGAIQLWGRELDSCLSRTGSWTVSWTLVAKVPFPHQLPFVQIHWISCSAVTGHDLFLSLLLVMMPESLQLEFPSQSGFAGPVFWKSLSFVCCPTHRNSELDVGRDKGSNNTECNSLDMPGHISPPASTPWLFWSLN